MLHLRSMPLNSLGIAYCDVSCYMDRVRYMGNDCRFRCQMRDCLRDSWPLSSFSSLNCCSVMIFIKVLFLTVISRSGTHHGPNTKYVTSYLQLLLYFLYCVVGQVFFVRQVYIYIIMKGIYLDSWGKRCIKRSLRLIIGPLPHYLGPIELTLNAAYGRLN